jgi:hypothetical protein
VKYWWVWSKVLLSILGNVVMGISRPLCFSGILSTQVQREVKSFIYILEIILSKNLNGEWLQQVHRFHFIHVSLQA